MVVMAAPVSLGGKKFIEFVIIVNPQWIEQL